MKWLLLITLVLAGLYVMACCVLFVMQDKLLYYPTPEAQPKGATVVHFRSGELTLKAWELHGQQPQAMLYFGGNGDDVAAKVPEFDAAFPDTALYLVHYRGYGGNPGTPTEKLLIEDAQALYDQVRAQHSRVAVMGRSLGSGVATALAATRPVDKLILVTPYDSIANVAAERYPWAPIRWLLRDSYDSVRRMPDVKAQVLILIAAHDESILRPRSEALVAATAPERRQVKIFVGANHNDINLQRGYRECIREFLAAP